MRVKIDGNLSRKGGGSGTGSGVWALAPAVSLECWWSLAGSSPPIIAAAAAGLAVVRTPVLSRRRSAYATEVSTTEGQRATTATRAASLGSRSPTHSREAGWGTTHRSAVPRETEVRAVRRDGSKLFVTRNGHADRDAIHRLGPHQAVLLEARHQVQALVPRAEIVWSAT